MWELVGSTWDIGNRREKATAGEANHGLWAGYPVIKAAFVTPEFVWMLDRRKHQPLARLVNKVGRATNASTYQKKVMSGAPGAGAREKATQRGTASGAEQCYCLVESV
jgi:hypothetical protein